jgi:site-specific recombinase XerC
MFYALRQYLPHRPKGDALFVKQNGKPLVGADGRDTVGRWLAKTFKRVLGKSLSSNMLRKIYISELLQDAPSLKIRLEALEKMGQLSLETQETYKRT